jgi:hypothetical protein
MPIYIEDVSAQVTVHSGEIPLTPAQLDQITKHVLRCLDERKRDEGRNRRADSVRASAFAEHEGPGH